jgi:hypothetical protein
MRAVSFALALCTLAVASGCGGDDDDVADDEFIRLDDASEEVALTLQELVSRGEVTTDDDVAARLIAPEDGAQLPADAPPTFEWSARGTARHGVTTGEFVWLHIEGPGMDTPIDLVAIESTTWTPEEEHWEILRTSTGPCEVQVVSAYVDRGIVEEAFRPGANPSFSVTE